VIDLPVRLSEWMLTFIGFDHVSNSEMRVDCEADRV
jgi:hypothetical protein